MCKFEVDEVWSWWPGEILDLQFLHSAVLFFPSVVKFLNPNETTLGTVAAAMLPCCEQNLIWLKVDWGVGVGRGVGEWQVTFIWRTASLQSWWYIARSLTESSNHYHRITNNDIYDVRLNAWLAYSKVTLKRKKKKVKVIKSHQVISSQVKSSPKS